MHCLKAPPWLASFPRRRESSQNKKQKTFFFLVVGRGGAAAPRESETKMKQKMGWVFV